jgi:hypothetical protein
VIVKAPASGAVVADYAAGSIPEVGGDAAVVAEPSAVRRLTTEVGGLVQRSADYVQSPADGPTLTSCVEHETPKSRAVPLRRRSRLLESRRAEAGVRVSADTECDRQWEIRTNRCRIGSAEPPAAQLWVH